MSLMIPPINPRKIERIIPPWAQNTMFAIELCLIAYVAARHRDVLILVLAISVLWIAIATQSGAMLGALSARGWVHVKWATYIASISKAAGHEPTNFMDFYGMIEDILEQRVPSCVHTPGVANGVFDLDGTLWSVALYEDNQVSIWRSVGKASDDPKVCTVRDSEPISAALWAESDNEIVMPCNPVPEKVLVGLSEALRRDIESGGTRVGVRTS